ncbi:sigma-54-dependent Fis family transcriptional regulator [candidate division LCP-89 bacterium B3_LCP]|uniref:Sigma-54-dependent Fis family transcriptional regulator n=1 Tax=candidate division LCP-89 bacterium B3_LCP TaxID=2012998 RepID=A0A532V590_UNCL8|nr:MAG: sigma-54-dependent Fis family transcriptional regulator [candidate division LCP-89 bacterium B3_LCP]
MNAMDDSMVRILVVDDEVNQTDSLVILLRREGFKAEGVYDAGQAMSFLRQQDIDLVITDLKMAGHDGIWLTEQIRRNYPEVVVLVLTAYGTIETAVRAVKSGAFDYILKPIQPEQLRIALERSLKWGKMKRKVRQLEDQLQERHSTHKFLGNTPAILRVLHLVDRIAGSDSTVLISGESGTGKELIAEMIHSKSLRRELPLVIVNCGALPETLQESELFGHVKGSFTGALRDKKGLLTEADGGSLFLDEVGELSLAAQVKLLRFLENGECRMVGSTIMETLDVRVIAATNRDLEKSVREGKFREDLFYRLNVIPISVPPLREIRDDIPLIALSFLDEFSNKMNKKTPRISEGCLKLLHEHNWPGNVRELRNLMERAVVVDQDGVIKLGDFPEQMHSLGGEIVESGIKKRLSLRKLEKMYILSTLEECGGSRKKTGQILGITKATLWRKLNIYATEELDHKTI